MSKDDVYNAVDFEKLLTTGRVRAWWAETDDARVGWCALSPWHNKYIHHDWHLFGGWVHQDWRNRGIFRAMWKYRLSLVPDEASVTVSVQPDKLASLKLAEEFGFTYLSYAAPWNIYLRPALAGGNKSA